jgi:hypothetical protein
MCSKRTTSTGRGGTAKTKAQKVASRKDYQEQAAAFFRSLGLAASTDERIIGVRGSHNVDVAVRSGTAEIKLLWIVECKTMGEAR